MDLEAQRHYVAPAMEFLLVLSALLSAVTGAFTGARPHEARQHHAAATQSVAVAEPSAKVAVPVARIAVATPRAPEVAVADARPVAPPPAAVPLYADRLIE
ncbi:MAG TPA: hypothetical protein VEX35_00380 [Allosphingosinicella sp.]|nr:hypothetical protein [Allosphingosinicella sp.]